MGQRVKTFAPSAALAVQGPFIAFLSCQSPIGYVVLSIVSGTLALGLGAFLNGPWSRTGIRKQALMASMGTLAMLVGWFADAGFGPLVGNRVCLCGCSDSLTGLGLVSRFHWMQGCMLAACAAVTLMAAREQPAPFSPGWTTLQVVASSILMLAGMAVAGWAMGTLRFQSPTSALFASYLAMSAGMVIGASFAARLQPWTRHMFTPKEAPSHDGWVKRPTPIKGHL